jgi:hypothetical protein
MPVALYTLISVEPHNSNMLDSHLMSAFVLRHCRLVKNPYIAFCPLTEGRADSR